jgi:hypothetical protein
MRSGALRARRIARSTAAGCEKLDKRVIEGLDKEGRWSAALLTVARRGCVLPGAGSHVVLRTFLLNSLSVGLRGGHRRQDCQEPPATGKPIVMLPGRKSIEPKVLLEGHLGPILLVHLHAIPSIPVEWTRRRNAVRNRKGDSAPVGDRCRSTRALAYVPPAFRRQSLVYSPCACAAPTVIGLDLLV